MTTWLPAITLMWFTLVVVVFATEPAFNHRYDRVLGIAIGAFVGAITSAALYVALRLLMWLIGGFL